MDTQIVKKLYQLSNNLNVLYVEDDLVLQNKTKLILDDLFASVDCCDNGVLGLQQYKEYYKKNNKYYDLLITDIQMPKMDGVIFSKEIKSINKNQNIIVISAYDDSKYLIKFIDIGIIKFIKKPFNFNSLIKQLSEVLEAQNTNKLHLDDNIIWDRVDLKLYNGVEEIDLSNSEVLLLSLFTNNINQIFSKYDLLNILEESYDSIASEDSVRSIIKRLRKKIPKDIIKNIYGQGYKLSL